jgi:molybdate transport system substrate-binding protein
MFLSLGCKENTDSSVTLFAGSSMADALDSVKNRFELEHPSIDLEIIFAGSQTLAMQIKSGAHADLFISADREQIDRVDGFDKPKLLVENSILAITPYAGITSIKDAIDRSNRIIVAHEDVPAGQYTRAALDAMGLWELAESKIVSYEHSVRGVLTKIASGQADLGFVYRTDAMNIDGQPTPLNTIEFPAEIQSTTQTWITIRSDTALKNSPASIVYQFLTDSEHAREIFVEHGFTVLPSDSSTPSFEP